MEIALIIPAFIAGILTFLAPCTFPLVPGYLAFISGVSIKDLEDPLKLKLVRKKIFLNGILFIIGFSLVFILFGTIFGLGGAILAKYRIWLSRIGGVFVIFFGLFMIGVLKLPFLDTQKNIFKIKILKPGNPASSFIFGTTFAFGWSPCVGPILGSILTLAASSTTVSQGAFLLLVFSLGLAIPFLLVAAFISLTSNYILKLSKYFNMISIIGGVFLIFLGILLLLNKLSIWVIYFYKWFNFIHYEKLINYL
jgi:cytochrome c-type biogenesis protein